MIGLHPKASSARLNTQHKAIKKLIIDFESSIQLLRELRAPGYEELVSEAQDNIAKLKKQIQPKGNWVNGENLDKIKFPAPCSYCNGYGIITRTRANESMDNDFYTLHSIDKQHSS